ncbi:MAG: hypothetical protein J6A94_06280 [Lachnospiraceae bacterium]|nr:hypothetical protein [Lachnospiraceae bacterium]
MKKFFNQTKKPYKKWDEREYLEEDFLWDDTEEEAVEEYATEDAYYAEEEEYIEEEYIEEEYIEEEAYYAEEAEEAYAEQEAYYAEEADEVYVEQDVYYAEEADEVYVEQEAYYAEEADEVYEEQEAYYAEEADEVYEEQEAYYAEEAEEAYAEQSAYYAEEIEAEDDREYYYKNYNNRRKVADKRQKQSFLGGLLAMNKMDCIVAATGLVVLVLAMITGGVFLISRTGEKKTSEFVSVGNQLADIEMIGEKGLMAVADAQKAKLAAAELVALEEAEKTPEYEENEYSNVAGVVLDMVSIQKDLKIKFTNKETDKLIPNVPFAVTVTDPDGKTAVWEDDDMDGIIYKKGITPGKYKVAVNALTDSKYKDYILPAGTESIEVKKDIAYEKVDVKNEIKTEAQVNASKEDTKKKETVVESTLQDTINWVESTVVADTYVEVPKSIVPDPLTLIASAKFMRTASVTVSGGNVAPQPLAMTLDKTAVTVYLNTPITVNATIANATTESAVTAESSDNEIATATASGKAVTITGVKTGSATITVKYTENGVEAVATCAVTVKAHPKDDTTSKLLDANGKQLYVMDGNKYREAVYADYYTAEQFFLRGDAKYTGWQTIDGKVYFFDASGKKVTGEQVIQGAKYNFASDGSLVTDGGTMGIDVSKWNGSIDWKAVKNSGVSYVIIRCGYRGSSAGALIEDPKYKSNIKGAIDAGLKVGVYFFTQAVDEVEAVEEASMVLELIKGYKISYPIFLDVEASGGRADGIDKATRTAVCKAFCATIQDAGYTAGVYANKTWLTSKIDASALSNYKIWLAQYAVTPTYTGKYDLWQYTESGRISGISGSVDLNISYLGY